MTTVTDGFAGTGALIASWSQGIAGGGTYSCSGGFLKPDAAGNTSFYYWNANTFTGNQYAQLRVKIVPVPGGGFFGVGPGLHYENSAGTFYLITFDGSNVYVNRAGVGLFSFPYVVANDEILGARSTITGASAFVEILSGAYPSGSVIGSGTDPTRLTGTLIGFASYSSDSTTRNDDFEGGDYVAGAADTLMGQACL